MMQQDGMDGLDDIQNETYAEEKAPIRRKKQETQKDDDEKLARTLFVGNVPVSVLEKVCGWLLSMWRTVLKFGAMT